MKSFFIKTYKSIVGRIEDRFTKLTPKNDLVVACMHSTPAAFNLQFEDLIHWVRKRYHVLAPNELSSFFNQPNRYQNGPYFIFTFDDGLKNNLHSARLLEKHGVSALYFVVPDFIEATDPEDYYRTNIRPTKEAFEQSSEDTHPMTWQELEHIQEMGHFIGSHTLTHLLSPSQSDAEIKNEIETSSEIIGQQLRQKVDFFASPNNTLESVDSRISNKIRESYFYHFTTVPGLFRTHPIDSHLVYRRNIEVHWKNKGLIAFALGSFDLRRWQAQRNALSQH